MMKFTRRFAILVAVSVCFFASSVASAEDSGEWSLFQFAVVPGVSLIPQTTPVRGLNWEPFWGGQHRVNGISLQSVGTVRDLAGLQLGFVNFATQFRGVDFSLASGVWESRGLQVGLVNLSGNSAPGFTHGEGKARGGGMQLGVFNSATAGFQIGLLNYNATSPLPWMILFNVSFR